MSEEYNKDAEIVLGRCEHAVCVECARTAYREALTRAQERVQELEDHLGQERLLKEGYLEESKELKERIVEVMCAREREHTAQAGVLMRFALLQTSDGPGIVAGDNVKQMISIRSGDIRDARELLGLPRGMWPEELETAKKEALAPRAGEGE